ncbi:MAG TPA: M23 family metallopeptidase [Candidatus Paceibacterota bacterium]|nr:M23 family metallopeptidase [Candidatus Paceibacterota bacterium]
MHRPSRISYALIALLAFTLVLPAFALPRAAEAQSSRYSRDRDDDRSSRSSYSYGRVSSSIRKKIDQLDDDAVEKLPIPILIGVAVRNLYPSFGDPRDGGAREHQGLDIMAPMGSFIASPTEAVVTRTGEGETEGIYVYTANPGGETFAYMHLSGIADGVKAGTVLEEGDLIGYVGDTGNAKGGPAHLHFEIRDGREPTDPFPRLTHEFGNDIRLRTLTEILKALLEELEDRN